MLIINFWNNPKMISITNTISLLFFIPCLYAIKANYVLLFAILLLIRSHSSIGFWICAPTFGTRPMEMYELVLGKTHFSDFGCQEKIQINAEKSLKSLMQNCDILFDQT